MIKWFVSAILTLGFYSAKTQSQAPYIAGKTLGKLPFLEYGLGEDRLGGAKMGFLDSNILLRVVDSSGTDYKVMLSANHHAYITKTSVQLLAGMRFQPYYLSNSWKVWGDTEYDYVSLQLDEKLPYHSFQEINPSRIVVDIFGITSNTNWITQLKTVKEVKNAWYEQVEDDVMRVFIELKHKQHWGHWVYYDSAAKPRLVIRVRRQPASLDIKKLKIAVDAGHGGDNEGATGVNTGILEKEYTLLIAKELEKALKKEKAKVVMTREKDTSLSMPERIEFLHEQSPDLLVSIHLNSGSSDTVRGASTYYRYIGFRPLSQSILKRMLELKLEEFGNVGSFNFGLNGPTEYPNCLVEVAFLSNPSDEKKIRDPAFRKAVAKKIVDGIRDWLLTVR